MQHAAARAAATGRHHCRGRGTDRHGAIGAPLVVGVPYIGNMRLGAAIAIGAVVVSALTILPIIIGAFGRKLVPRKREHVDRLPTRSAAAPLRRPGHPDAPRPPDDGNKPESQTQRVAYDQLTQAFNAGFNGPFLLAIDTAKAPRTPSSNSARSNRRAETPGVATVRAPSVSEDGEMPTIFAIRTTAPPDARTSDLLARLRDVVIPRATAGTPLAIYVGGNTAGFEDVTDKGAGRLPRSISS
jgi:RND superfamily putative drug exporter